MKTRDQNVIKNPVRQNQDDECVRNILILGNVMAGATRLELATSGVTGGSGV